MKLLKYSFNSFLVSGHFCHLRITFANSLDPDPGQQNIVSDLDLNHFDTLIVLLKEIFEK